MNATIWDDIRRYRKITKKCQTQTLPTPPATPRPLVGRGGAWRGVGPNSPLCMDVWLQLFSSSCDSNVKSSQGLPDGRSMRRVLDRTSWKRFIAAKQHKIKSHDHPLQMPGTPDFKPTSNCSHRGLQRTSTQDIFGPF